MSVHLVETSEEDSYLAVTRHVADLLNEGQVSRRFHSDEVLCFIEHRHACGGPCGCKHWNAKEQAGLVVLCCECMAHASVKVMCAGSHSSC